MEPPYTVSEIEQDVVKWYFKKKSKIPASEKMFLEAYRKQETEANTSLCMWTGPDCSYIPSATYTISMQTEKPVYGTPEFWKAWWAKKKATEAAAATDAAAAATDGLAASISIMTISTKPKKKSKGSTS